MRTEVFLEGICSGNSVEYKPPKRKRVNLHMPDLSVAVEEVYREMIRRDNDLRFHPAFKRRGRPQYAGFSNSSGFREEEMKKQA